MLRLLVTGTGPARPGTPTRRGAWPGAARKARPDVRFHQGTAVREAVVPGVVDAELDGEPAGSRAGRLADLEPDQPADALRRARRAGPQPRPPNRREPFRLQHRGHDRLQLGV